MGQTKCTPLRTRDFLKLSEKNFCLYLEHMFLFKIITRNKHYFVHHKFKY